MVVNCIVLAVTVLMALFVGVWCCCPWLRPWFEAPKYRILARENHRPTTSATSVLERERSADQPRRS